MPFNMWTTTSGRTPVVIATSAGSSSTAATIQPFFCGGMSACFASAIIHPIDLAKVRLQLFETQFPGKPKPSFPTLLSELAAKDGFGALYAGLSASMMRQAIYGTARLGLHRTISDKLEAANKGAAIPFWQKFAAGSLGGATAVIIGTPMDVALVRMQADSMADAATRRNYANVIDALRRIAAEEGPASLYSGLAPNILRGIAMNVGQMVMYDQAKEMVCAQNGDDPKKPGTQTKLGCAAIAGFSAAFFSLPFDMLKSRLQNQKPGADGKMPYKGLVDVATKLVTAEGVPALWTGFSSYYMRCAPHAMLILLTIEQLTPIYKKTFNC